MRSATILLLGALALPSAGMTLSVGIHAGGGGSHRQRCLKFMHLPKNAGSSIERAGLGLPQEEQPFRSFTSDGIDRAMASNPWYTGKRSEFFSEFLNRVNDDNNHKLGHEWLSELFIKQPDGELCKHVHTAPRVDRGVAAYFLEDGCETFCVVREPVSRFLSAASMELSRAGLHKILCNPGEFEDYTRSLLTTLRNHPWEFGCRFNKQVDMVYGAQRKSTAQTQYCTRILSFENISKDFNSLMLEYGSNLTMPEKHYMSFPSCGISPDIITTATKDMILDYYSEDVAVFGYNSRA